MSQNGDPRIAISMGIYSIEGPDVGFMRGCNIYIYVCICTYIYIYIHIGSTVRPKLYHIGV